VREVAISAVQGAEDGMAEDTPPVRDEMGYEAMAQAALRGLIRMALERAASPEGIPGEHHFYITFKTRAPGVKAPGDVRAKYPDEMTVVLQHQYWDLVVGDAHFSVMLKFGGQAKVLSIPYMAITRFYDPSVQFLLQFETPEVSDDSDVEDATPEAATADAAPGAEVAPIDPDQPKVVSLDQFRKK
jgi:hypothetical protein